MESDPHTSTVQTRIRNEEVVFDINIPLPDSLIQLHLGPESSQDCRKRHVNLRLSQVHTDALPRPSPKIEQVSLSRFFLRPHPARRVEPPRFRKDRRVVVHMQRAHSDGRTGRNGPVPESQGIVWVNTLEAMNRPV